MEAHCFLINAEPSMRDVVQSISVPAPYGDGPHCHHDEFPVPFALSAVAVKSRQSGGGSVVHASHFNGESK